MCREMNDLMDDEFWMTQMNDLHSAFCDLYPITKAARFSPQNGFDYLLTYSDDPQTVFPRYCLSWMVSSGEKCFICKVVSHVLLILFCLRLHIDLFLSVVDVFCSSSTLLFYYWVYVFFPLAKDCVLSPCTWQVCLISLRSYILLPWGRRTWKLESTTMQVSLNPVIRVASQARSALVEKTHTQVDLDRFMLEIVILWSGYVAEFSFALESKSNPPISTFWVHCLNCKWNLQTS